MKPLDRTTPRRVDMSVQPQVARKPEATEKIEAPLAPTTWDELQATLSGLQLRLIDAQTYIQQGLSLARLVETSLELEDTVGRWLLSDGTAVRPDIERTIVSLAKHGPVAIAQLAEIVEAQLFARPNAAVQEIIADVMLHALPRPSADHAAAFASSLAGGRALGAGLSKEALYPGLRLDYAGSNSFTNEPGLPELASKTAIAGGASIGVGGAIFDLGSRGADLIISVDANPRIKEAIHLFTGVLLAVAKSDPALDAEARAEKVLHWLERGPNAETTEALQKLGLPATELATLDQQLSAIRKKLRAETVEAHPIPFELWCRGPGATSRIAHLTKLALEGKIIAVTADLSDPTLVDRINILLDAHGTRAQVVHLSNALDYIPDVGAVLANLGNIRRNQDAVMTACAGSVVRNAVQTTMADDYFLIDALGTLPKPKALPAKDWLGNTSNARRLHTMLWETGPHVRQLLEYTQAAFELPAINEVPRSPAQYFGLLEQAISAGFENAEWARARVKVELEQSGRWEAYRLAKDGAEPSLERSAAPKSAKEISAAADRFDAEFWSAEGHKANYVRARLGAVKTIVLKKEIERCRSFEDLVELERRTS